MQLEAKHANWYKEAILVEKAWLHEYIVKFLLKGMCVGAEQIIVYFLKQGTARRLKEEKCRGWQFNLLVGQDHKCNTVHQVKCTMS